MRNMKSRERKRILQTEKAENDKHNYRSCSMNYAAETSYFLCSCSEPVLNLLSPQLAERGFEEFPVQPAAEKAGLTRQQPFRI